MKKIMNVFVLVAAVAMALVSCNKQEIENPNSLNGEYVYTFKVSDETKATLGDEFVKWEAGDQIGVYTDGKNGVSYNRYGDITLGSPVTFKVSSFYALVAGDMVHCYYPYVKTNSKDPRTVNLSIPTSQTEKNQMPMVSLPYAVTEALAEKTDSEKSAGEIRFANLGSVIEFHVYSTTEAYQAELVKSVTFNADQAIAGNFTFDITAVDYSDEETLAISGYEATKVVSTLSTSTQVSSDKNAATVVKMVVAPGSYTGNIVVATDKATYTYPISNAKEFNRSAVKPLGVDLAKGERAENVVEPEQTFSWVLTDLTQINAGDQVVIVSTKDGNSYAMSNDKGASAAPNAVKVTVSNSLLSETPADNLIWHFDVANNQYTFYKDSGKQTWLYCTNTNNGVRVGDNTNKVYEIKENYLYHTATSRYIGVYNAQDWRCYTSINTNITGQTLQFYVKTIGVETPDVPKIPELTITPELVEVPAAGGNADFSYEVVNPIEGTYISASTTADWIADFDYTTPNKVTFTVTENTLEEAREAVIQLHYEGAESKTVTVKQDAKVPEGMLVDVLTRATTGVTNTSYAEWSGKTASSDAVYAGNTAGGNSSIQMRDNTNSGIVTTTSGGYAKKVVVTWNSNTADARTLNIYGKNTAYSATTDLYNSTNQGTLLGTIKMGTSTEFEIPGNYQYIGLRSASGAMYITEIQITWSSSPIPLESIAVSGQKEEYYVGDSFEEPTVTATYIDGSSSVVSSAEFSGYDMSLEGEQTVTVSYTQADVTKETTYTIKVNAKPALTSIVIDGTPKTEYTVGETFVAPSVKATYSDNSSSLVSGAEFSGYNLETAGNQTVNVSYTENGITKSTSYGIVVKAAQGGVKKFVKVTSAPSDWSGTYLIVYETGKVAFDGSRTTMDAVGNTKSVTIANGEIDATDTMMAIAFTIAKSGTDYTVKSKSGYYVGQTSNANGLKSSTSTSYKHTLSMNGNDVNLVSGGAYLRYNAASDQTRFRYYKSSSYTGQKAIQLYKLQN